MGDVKKNVQSIAEQLKGRYSLLGLPDGCLVEKWNVKKDIIIAGGCHKKSVEIFSWTTRQWTHLPPMTSVRRWSSSFVHEDQMFVCCGVRRTVLRY